MAKEFGELRNFICKILESHALSEEGVNERSKALGNSQQCSWMLFEEFGVRLLQEIGYEGDYGAIDIVKDNLKNEGWNYDEF